jgi:hypothetical protein
MVNREESRECQRLEYIDRIFIIDKEYFLKSIPQAAKLARLKKTLIRKH